MDTAILIARLLLAAVFVVSGVAKLMDRPGSRKAVVEFGVPDSLAGPLAALLPWGELAIAASLIPSSSAWWGALAGGALLLLFITAIAVNLARGRAPDCHCFGQLANEAIGWSTIARNAALVAVAGFALSRGPGHHAISAIGWFGDLAGAERISLVIGLAALVLVGGALWLLLQIISQNGRLLARLDELEQRLAAAPGVAAAPELPKPAAPAAGLPMGTLAPSFALSGLFGETLTLDALRAAGKPVLLNFMDPGCGPCTALLPDVARWQQELAPRLTIALLSRGTIEENRGKTDAHGLTHVLLQADREVSDAYKSYGTPGAVLVLPNGTIGSPVAAGAEQIRALVARHSGTVAADPALPVLTQPLAHANGGTPCPNCGKVHDQAPAAAPQTDLSSVGKAAPALVLPDLAGKSVDLADYRGRETLLLFWNPGCGFCQKMLPDLIAWEADRPERAPALLIVSTGTSEANAAQGLLSTVLLDDGFNAGRGFGAGGTPSAVLVDAAGMVASGVGVGAQAVLALARGEGRPALPPSA